MSRYIKVTLEKRGVSCVARLLDDEAPRTAAAVWEALPISSPGELAQIIDLALFYGRNNLLLNGDQGWVPGNVFGAVVDGMAEMAAACQDLWLGGVRGETLTWERSHEV